MNAIEACALKYGASGAIAIVKDGMSFFLNTYGPTDMESTYLLSLNSRFIMGLCIGKLLDEKKLRLTDKLSRFMPEYVHAQSITVLQLLIKESGIPDFFAGNILKALQKDEAYLAMDQAARNRFDRELALCPYTYTQALEYVNGLPLTCVPGTHPTDDLENMTETLFIRQVIEQASGQQLKAFAQRVIFSPLKIQLGEDLPDNRYTITLNPDGGQRLLMAVTQRALLSEKAWAAITKKYVFGCYSIAFCSMLDMLSAREFTYGATGLALHLFFDWEGQIGLMYLTNLESPITRTPEGAQYLEKALVQETEAAFLVPRSPKLVPFSKANVFQAMGLAIAPDQLAFMNTAQRAICLATAFKHKLFILMEGPCAVGLIALSIDHKKGEYYIEQLLIDARFQRRGFGKIMLNQALAYLKAQGCHELAIGVHRNNVAAQKLYQSCGFTVSNIYEDFMRLEANV